MRFHTARVNTRISLQWGYVSFRQLRTNLDFRVKIWGTSSPEDKLAGGLGNVIEATSTGGRWSDFFTAEKLAASNLGLLQQYLPLPDSCSAAIARLGQRLADLPSTELKAAMQSRSKRNRRCRSCGAGGPGRSRDRSRLGDATA